MKAIATEENIRKAYKKLKEEGIDPTVENIRKAINGGSNSTIYKILHMIEEEIADTVICSNDPDEDALIKDYAIPLVQGLFQKCKKRAEELAKAQYRSLASADENLANKIKRLDEIEEQATDKITAAEAKRETAIIKADALTSQLQSIEKELKQKDSEIAAIKKQAEDAITTLKQQREAEITALKQQREVELSVLNQQIKELKQAQEQQVHTNQLLEKILTQVASNNTRSTRTKTNCKQSKKEKEEL